MEEEQTLGWKRVLPGAQESHGWTCMYFQISMCWLCSSNSQNGTLVPSVRDWREETLGTKISTVQTKKTRENNVTQKPQITWSSLKGNSWSNHWKTITKDSKRCTNTQSQQVTHYSQLFDDLASSCGEIKKAASNAIHAHYDLFPSKDSNLLKAQTCNHVKEITTELIKKSLFAHSSNDEKVHVQFLSLDFIHAPWRTTWSPLVTQPSVNCFTSLCMAMSIGSEIFEQKNLDTIFWMGHYLLPSPW